MKFHIITVGAPKLEYARIGCEMYATRLERFHKVRFSRVRDSKKNGEAAMLDEGHAILEAVGKAFLFALDPNGQQLETPALAQKIETLGVNGESELTFCIGGDEGLSEAVKTRANQLWSLSKLTFPHDLAQLVLLEALYRASTISAGIKYHK
jgi:23S rRNA (pseudouridine1915-N3)-methyltransferase